MTDHDDDYPDDPPAHREVVLHPMEHVGRSAAMRDPVFYGALKESQDDNPRVRVRGLARMFALTIDAGEATPAFLDLPGHLPGETKDQRMLLSSHAAADADLRQQLIDWARRNERAAAPAAKTLANAIAVYRDGMAELARAHQAAAAVDPSRQAAADARAALAAIEARDPGEEDLVALADELEKARAYATACDARLSVAIEACAIDQQLSTAVAAIGGWVRSAWQVSITEAPAVGVEAWAEELVARVNPCPRDLLGAGRPSFMPVRERGGGAANPFGGRR